MKRRKKIMILLALVCILLVNVCFEGFAVEKAYPTKPIKLVVPYNPGGGSDISARIFAKYAEEFFGQPIIVANISGAGGSVGGQEVLNSSPDGYTLFWHHAAMHVAYHTGVADFTWDSFTPICQGAFSQDVIAVSKEAPWNNIEELMAYIEKNPKKVRMGVNIGATTHFVGVGMDIATGGGNIIFVAGGGDSDRITKLLGGFTEVTPITISTAKDFMTAGKIKALAVTGPKRSPYLPELPTMIERGYDVISVKDYGVFAPPGLPSEIGDFISKTFEKMTQDERILKDLDKLTVTPLYRNYDEFTKNLLEEDVKFYKIARFAGLIK